MDSSINTMHIEFAYMLSGALNDYLQTKKSENLKDLIFSAIELEEPEKKRLTAAHPIGASSSIAFKLSQYLSVGQQEEEMKKEFYSNNIAQALKENLEKYNKLPFVLEISGAVYLNAYLSKESCEKLFNIFLQTKEKDFFDLNCLLLPGFEIINKFRINEYKIDWHQILLQFAESKDLCEQELFQIVNVQKNINLEQRLMMLAALSDRDLDLRSYLHGLAGRQNVPWYFAKFFRDSANYLSFLESRLNEITSSKRLEKNDFRMPDYLQNGVSNFFSLRKVFFESFFYSKPEKLMGSLLSLLRNFYDLYNRPNFRMLQGDCFSREEVLALKLYLEKLISSLNYIFSLLKQ